MSLWCPHRISFLSLKSIFSFFEVFWQQQQRQLENNLQITCPWGNTESGCRKEWNSFLKMFCFKTILITLCCVEQTQDLQTSQAFIHLPAIALSGLQGLMRQWYCSPSKPFCGFVNLLKTRTFVQRQSWTSSCLLYTAQDSHLFFLSGFVISF